MPVMNSLPVRRTLLPGVLLAPAWGGAAPPGLALTAGGGHAAGGIDFLLILVLALAVLSVVLLLLGRRKRREIEAHGAHRIRQMTELIEHADCALWEANVDVRGPQWQWTMTIHPSAFARKLFRGVLPAPGEDLWAQFRIKERTEMDRRARQAMDKSEPGYVQEFSATRDGQTLWLREDVSVTATAPGRFRLVGLITDITARHQAEDAQRQSEQTVDRILAHAQCLIWRARVVMEDGGLQWTHFDIPQSQFSELLFGQRVYSRDRGFWEKMTLPDEAEMNVRSTSAILNGAPGYTQRFRVINQAGRLFWLHERVSVTKIGESSWSVVGVATDATAQHEAEEAKRSSETKLSYLLEMADCLVWEATVVLRDNALHWDLYTQRSVLYRRLFGEREEVSLVWETLDVPELQEMTERALQAVKNKANGYTQEFRVVKPDETIWLREVVTMVELPTGAFRLVGVITDITAQRRAEAAESTSQLRLTELLSRADCLLWEASATLLPGDWTWEFKIQPSGLCQTLYGAMQPPPETGLWRSFDIPEKEEMRERCQTAMREGLPGYEQVFHIVRADGSMIWISESVTIKRVAADRYSLVGVAVDITPQRGAEEALAAEKERLSVTLRAMNESVITTDVGGVVQFMNPAAAALTGWNESEACGRPVVEICRLESKRTLRALTLPVQQVARGDMVSDIPPDTRLITRRNRPRMIEGCCAPIHAVDSKVIGTVLVLRDVTEQDLLEQELIRATRLESVGVLAGGIAHDFNNILTAVMGNVALAQLDVPSEGPAAVSLRSAEKAALRARDLTQQLLTFAKGGEPVRAAVQIEAVVREMTSFALHGSQVKAFFEINPGLWPADADKGQIGRVVQNLVINAVQAMPNGGSIRITARNEILDGLSLPGLTPGNYILIAIADTGEGIQSEHLARIFDPYFTTKQTGTGLGLAAAYSIVKKHHGHIDVESEVGKGTTFRIWLPALLEDVPQHSSRTPWDPGRMNGRVLFMDDEQIIRDMASTLLRRFGLTVDCATDGAEAIEKYQAARARGEPYNLVIMDLTIPGGMGGLAAVRKLHAIDPNVKAIVSSGYSSDPVLANYREHGFVAMVPKPYEMGELARVLREVLPSA